MRLQVAVLLCAFFVSASAHEAHKGWEYDADCCSDRDCFEIEAKGIKQVPGGYELATGEFVAQSKVRQSKDEDYHLCRHNRVGTIFCLYIPNPGS